MPVMGRPEYIKISHVRVLTRDSRAMGRLGAWSLSSTLTSGTRLLAATACCWHGGCQPWLALGMGPSWYP
jgi:hypothetical protein